MNTTPVGRRASRTMVALVLAATAALGLAGCQSPASAVSPAGTVDTADTVDRRPDPALDRAAELAAHFGGRPADRIAEAIAREVALGHLPSPNCVQHRVVEHPAGGWHLTCIQPAE